MVIEEMNALALFNLNIPFTFYVIVAKGGDEVGLERGRLILRVKINQGGLGQKYQKVANIMQKIVAEKK